MKEFPLTTVVFSNWWQDAIEATEFNVAAVQ